MRYRSCTTHSRSLHPVSSIVKRCVAVACFCVFLSEPLSADHYRLRAKCSGEKRLSAELVLVRRAKSHFRGMCRDGKGVYDVAETQVPTVQTMASHVDTEIPPEEERSIRLLISYSDRNTKPARETLQAAGLKLVEDYESGSFLIVEPHDGSVTATTVEALMADQAVTYAAPDYIMSTSQLGDEPPAASDSRPNDQMFDRLWGMQNSGAAKVWPVTHDAANIVVGVIDTGVDYLHPDLKDNMWTRAGKHGYDFYENDDDPMDEQDHGTHCAGTIAGVIAQKDGAWKCLGGRSDAVSTGKRPGLQGPIDDAFSAPFLCVRGTGKPWNADVNAWTSASLRRFEYEWARYMRGDLPIKNDTDVTEADVRDKNLILFGDPGSNSWIARALPQLPVTWTRESVSLHGEKYLAVNHSPVFICASPLAANRYVVINSGHTFHEKDFAAFNYLLFPRLGDWAITKVLPGSEQWQPTSPVFPEDVIRAGYFDESWQDATTLKPQ